jgi:peptide/nickel transport system substrate-binding protein
VDLPPNVRRVPVPLDEYAVLSFNVRQQPFDDVTFRQALVLGFDKQQMVDRALNGLATPLETPILSGSWAFDPSVEPSTPDLAAAARTLDELGFVPGIDGTRFRDGVPLRLELITDGNPRRGAAAAEVQRQWAQLGIAVEIVELDAEALGERLATHDFALALHGWTRIGPDPDPFALWHSSQAERGLNYAGLRDEQIDELLVNARVNSDTAERAADYAAFQRRWLELAPSITLYQPLYIFAAEAQLGGLGFAENLGPVQPTLFGLEDRYRSVTRWYLNSSLEIRGNLP